MPPPPHPPTPPRPERTEPDLAPPPGAMVGACRVQGRDVATELVRVGFARPVGIAPRAMLEAEAEAQADRRGLWRGDWKIVQRR